MNTTRKITTTTKAMKIEGVPQLVKTLNTIMLTLSGEGVAAFNQRLRDICMKPALTIKREAQDLAPVETGKLKAGLFAAPLKAKPGAVVGVHHVWYAPYVEFGSSRASAHPFLRPAINAARPLFANMMAGDIAQLIADAAATEAWHGEGG